jgi:protein-tyrosine phosphatase
MASKAHPTSVLFVCVGNICRSPCLEAVMKQMIKEKGLSQEVFVDSCAISSYHIGCKADHRMRLHAKQKGIEIDHIAKMFDPVFLDAFDYIFAVDNEVKKHLLSHSTPKNKHKIYLATAFSKQYPFEEIPDPYYGGEKGFHFTLDMAYDCCLCILSKIVKDFEKT